MSTLILNTTTMNHDVTPNFTDYAQEGVSRNGHSRPWAAQGAHPPKQTIRVLLADDHPIVRKGLAEVLSRQPHLTVVGEAEDGRQAVQKARELRPDLVLMDIDMPNMNGFTAAETLRAEQPRTRVILVSMYNNPEYVRRIMQAGARGYVLKSSPLEELLQAVELVQSGEVFFSPAVARLALNQFVRPVTEDAQQNSLTNREREVLTAIAEGLSNKEIACRLNVGVRTVETHRERVMRKLNIHSVAGLTRYAIARGLVAIPSAAGAMACKA